MLTTSKWLAIVAVAFVAGSFIASPGLRAFAANTVFSADIVDGEVRTADMANNSVTSVKIKDGDVKAADLAGNSVTSAKIKDAEVKAADIAADSVAAEELVGVSKLIFAECQVIGSNTIAAGTAIPLSCLVPGAAVGDNAFVSHDATNLCFSITRARVSNTDSVSYGLVNACNSPQLLENFRPSVIVFDK